MKINKLLLASFMFFSIAPNALGAQTEGTESDIPRDKRYPTEHEINTSTLEQLEKVFPNMSVEDAREGFRRIVNESKDMVKNHQDEFFETKRVSFTLYPLPGSYYVKTYSGWGYISPPLKDDATVRSLKEYLSKAWNKKQGTTHSWENIRLFIQVKGLSQPIDPLEDDNTVLSTLPMENSQLGMVP